jgi:hypothetical protein
MQNISLVAYSKRSTNTLSTVTELMIRRYLKLRKKCISVEELSASAGEIQDPYTSMSSNGGWGG